MELEDARWQRESRCSVGLAAGRKSSGIHLASCKLVVCEDRSEVSRTAKDCTDEQKLHKRQLWVVEVAQQTESYNPIHNCRCSGGNPKAYVLTQRGLGIDSFSMCRGVSRGHSRQGNERLPNNG